MPSIEILVEHPRIKLNYNEMDLCFSVDYSNPPKSHRDPSMWQKRFSVIKGDLYHLGNPEFKAKKKGWFFAYELISEDEKCERFKFSSKYLKDIMKLLKSLLRCSENKIIHLTTDWQIGKKRGYIYKRPLRFDKFSKIHHLKGFRLNSWITIKL